MSDVLLGVVIGAQGRLPRLPKRARRKMRGLLFGRCGQMGSWSARAIVACALMLMSELAMADQMLTVTPSVITHLRALKVELNFEPDDKTYYTGVADPALRTASDQAFSNLVDSLAKELPEHPSKQFVLDQFKATLDELPLSDTEDRERAAGYCEKIMDVLAIQSSDGVLNSWLYGPVLGRMLNKKAHGQ